MLLIQNLQISYDRPVSPVSGERPHVRGDGIDAGIGAGTSRIRIRSVLFSNILLF